MKRSLKATANFVATLLVAPCLLACLISRLMGVGGRVFPGCSQLLSLVPGLAGEYVRRAFYRGTFPRCGADVCLGFGTVFSHPMAGIGRRVYVGLFCCLGDVELGDDVLLASHVSIANGGAQHGIDRLDVPIREQPGRYPRVMIGEGTWVGERAVVMADIGKHCVIGAGAVVTRPIPDYAIAVGVPARVVRYRNGAPISTSARAVLPLDAEGGRAVASSPGRRRGLGG